MDDSQLRNEDGRHYHSVVAFAVGVLTAILMAMVLGLFLQPKEAIAPEVQPVETAEETVTEEKDTNRSSPVAIRIPKIDVDTIFEAPLGLNDDQTIQVPDSYEEVGWYKYGPTPGEVGPAVVLGHVDSYEGPAVFYSLGQLEEGDSIFIDRADGSTLEFVVDHLERHDQADFPTAKVYSDLDYAGLRLITCTGVYSHSSLRYSHNLIVFARLVE